MAERNLNLILKKRLINNEPFAYAHLIKYERPSATSVSGKHSTDAKRYAYLTDATVNIVFDDGSYATDGGANGNQTYIADKIAKIGSYSETSQAKATGMMLDLGAESLNNSVTASMTMTTTTITASSVDFVTEGFREGDKISITDGTNDGHEIKIIGIKTNNTVLKVSNIDSTLATQSGATSTTLKIISDELKGPLLDRNDSTLKSYHNRDVFIYKAFLDPDDYSIIGAPNLIFKGIISSASLKEDPSKSMRVSWKLTSHWGDFSVVNGRWTNDAVHRALDNEGNPQEEICLKEVYAKDLGFQHAETTMHILATYKTIEQETRYKKKKNLFGLLPSTYKPYEVDIEVEHDVDLNWALSSKYIPVVYGVDRLTGIPIFVDTKSNDSNNVFIVYALAEGEIGGIYDLYVENEPLICSNLEDYDDRNNSGYETDGSTVNSADNIDVVCRGRADKGDTLGGENLTGSNSSVTWPIEGLAGTLVGFIKAAELDVNSINFYEIDGLDTDAWDDLDLDNDTKSTDGSGVLDGKTIFIDKPNNMRFTIHSGKTNQDADDTLVTIAEGVKFKRQDDYFGDAGQTYWGPNHTLSDTAYVVVDCEIAEDATEVPEVEYVIRGKYVDSLNYDFSYLHDPTVTITGAEAATHFSVGDTIGLKNSTGDAYLTKADDSNQDDLVIIDKWTIYGPDGLETRFRFSEAPRLTYSNGVPAITSFYMVNSASKTWHMVTYNHGQNSGTIVAALSASGTTTTTGQVPVITFASDPGWVDIFPSYQRATNQLPIAFTESTRTYKNTSFPVTHSVGGTVLTMTGATNATGFIETGSYGEPIIRTDAIKLVSGNANDDYYNGMTVTLTIEHRTTGDTTEHTRKIVDYDGGTGTAQVDVVWDKGKEPYRDNATYLYTYAINTVTDRRVSINPAMQLLDYMTSKTYGKRLDLTKDMSLSDWLFAARTCDSRGTQTLTGTSISATEGDRYILQQTDSSSSTDAVIAMGRVQSTVSSSTTVVMEECFGKFSKTFMKNHHTYIEGDIIQTSTGYYKVGSSAAGTISTKPTHASGTTNGLTFLANVTLRKLGTLGTTITLTNVSSGVYSDYTNYSIYNSDFVKMWRYLGWEDHHQRWVTRHQLCGTLDTATSVFDNINGFLKQFNGLLSYESGLYVLKIETTSTAITSDIADSNDTGYTVGSEMNVRYITNEDIIGSIKVTDPGPKKAYNTMTSTIADPGSRFKGKAVSFYDSNFLKTDKMVIKSGTHTQPAVSSYYNARVNVENALRKSRFGMRITFQLGPKALLLLAGETIAITYAKFGWSAKKFRISNISFNTDCTANITATEYDDSFYTISTPVLASLANDDVRASVQAVLGTPNGLAADAVTMGNIDLTWINGSNVAPANTTEVWVASSNDRTKAQLLTDVHCVSSIKQRVNGAVTGSASVTLDSGNGVLIGQKVTGPNISTTVTVAAISGTSLTLSSVQTLANNAYLTFDNTASYQHSIGEDAQAKYYWIRHKKLTNKNIPRYSGWHPTSATAGVTATSTIPEVFYAVTVSSDAQTFTANSSGVIQSPDTVKFTATKNNLTSAFVWSTDPSVSLYAAATGGSPVTSGSVVYLRKGDFSGDTVSVTATVDATDAEELAGADANYSEIVAVPKIASGGGAGNDAKSVRLRSSSYVFKEAEDDVSSAPGSPDYIQFDAVKQNTTATASWATSPSVTLYDASTGGSVATTGNTIYMRKADYGTNTSVTVTLTCDSIVDKANIVRLVENSGTVQAVLSNVAHVLPADYLGAVTDAQAVGSGTNIRVYEGVQALAFVTGTPGAGEWALSVGNTANIVEGGVTDNGTYATIASHTSVTTGTDTYKITYTISGKTRKAEAFTNFTVDQYLTKAKGGADGVIGYSVRLEAEDYSVLYNAAGSSPAFTDANSDGDIALTTTEVGFTTPYYRFKIATADWTSWSTTSTSTFDVPSSVFTPAKVMKVEVREGNSGDAAASDSISIYPIQPGSDGSDGSVFVELQIQYQGTAAQYATPSTPTGGSYNFATSAFTPPTNWTLAMPEGENYKPVWVSVATASAAAGGTDSSITWTSAQLLDQGNQIIDIYYNKSATIPTPPTTTFGSTPVGWSTTVPSGSDTLWQAIGYGDLSEGNYYRYVWGPVTQVTFTAYTVICTNEAHTYSSDITGGGVLTTNSGTSFEVFRGSTQLTGILTGTPTVDQFKVTATGTNITPSSTYGGSVASKVVVFADHTAGTIMSGVGNLAASISYSIAISTGVQAKTVTKKQTFVKTLKPKAPVGNFAYITSGEIERNGAGTYSATYLDIDFTFNEEGAAVSRDRFRIARSSDTWSGTLGTPGAHASGDLATGLLATAVTVSGKAAVLKVTYTDSAGVTANVSAPVKISHDGVGSYVAYLYKLNDTSLTSTSAGTFAAPLTGNTDWSLTVPSLTADGDKVYVSSRFFTQDGASPQDSAWATPTIHSQRTDGTAAVNSRYPTLYRLNSNTVADVDGGTFANPRTGNTDWNYAVPTMTANGHIVYAISRIFTSDAASPQEDEWSTPAIYATRVDGQTVTGPAGQGVRQANLYKLNDTTLTSSSAGTFADPQTGNADWDFDVPAVASDGDKVYVATRTFTSNAASPQDSAWSTPSIYAHRTDGTDGSTGASVNIVFARAASVPSTPTASSGVPSQDIQWYDSAPSGTDVLWASRGEKGVGATNFTWTTPFQIEGEAHAEVAIYRKTTVSETPSGGSYNFATSTLTAPTNWSQTVPTLSSNGDKVWLSVGLFSGASTATAATTTWTASVLYAQRTDGSDAVNSRYPTLYRLNSNTVADTDGGSFADPRTGNTDWNYAVPTMTANGHIVYAISRIFTSDGNSPQESAWSTPAIYAQRVDGSTITGPAGQGSRFVSLYNKNDSSLGSTTAGSFATPLHADNSNDGWQYAVPALSANLDKIYVTTRLFTSDGASPQDSNWVTPVIYAERVDGQGVNYAKLYSLNDASIGNTTAGTFANPASGQEAGWTLVPPDIGTVDGNKIYISTRTFTSDGESPQTAAWLTPTVYQIYTVGDPGFRTIQGYLFYEKTTANAPAAPSGNTYTFSTGLVTGTGITNNAANDTWNNVPNTQDATSSNTFYMVRYYGTEAAAESSTINVLYSAVIEQTSFTGIVTFSSGSFVTGGSNITTIDGGNITTGSVDADKVAAGSFTVTGGGVGGWTINSTSIYTGTEDHSGYTANAGDMTIYSNETDSSIHAKNFYIDTAGNLTATNVTLTGTITASDGAIGGWEVDSDKIYSSSNLASNAVEAVIIDKTQNYILIRDDSS